MNLKAALHLKTRWVIYSIVYSVSVYINKTHLSDSKFQQQKAEAEQQQLQQQQLLLAVGSTAYYHKLQQELWILRMSMSPMEREWKKNLLRVKRQQPPPTFII